jgi:hypothetical protein
MRQARHVELSFFDAKVVTHPAHVCELESPSGRCSQMYVSAQAVRSPPGEHLALTVRRGGASSTRRRFTRGVPAKSHLGSRSHGSPTIASVAVALTMRTIGMATIRSPAGTGGGPSRCTTPASPKNLYASPMARARLRASLRELLVLPDVRPSSRRWSTRKSRLPAGRRPQDGERVGSARLNARDDIAIVRLGLGVRSCARHRDPLPFSRFPQ